MCDVHLNMDMVMVIAVDVDMDMDMDMDMYNDALPEFPFVFCTTQVLRF
jgi:hypothetical protein